MKHINLLCIFLFCSTGLFAQISTTNVVPKAKPKPPENLILEKNYQGRAVGRYLGQTLYVKGISETLREYAYEGFYKDEKLKKIYKKRKGLSVIGRSEYTSLVGRYFEVVEIIEYSSYNEDILKLKDKDSGEILYFLYNGRYEHTFPFLAVSYFERLKKEYAGQEVVFTEQAKRSIRFISAEDQEKEVESQTWTCIDLTIEEQYYQLSLVVSSADGTKAYVPYERLENKKKGKKEIFLKSEADRYTERFGEASWQTILAGKVRAGFTEEMVLLSWGKPVKINQASYGNQWVYDGQYLYFERGVMTSFN